MALPCLWFLIIEPKAKGSDADISSIASTCKKSVSGVGFSKGWAELALKKPPPLVPRNLMASCEAVGPRAMVCSPPSRVCALDIGAQGLHNSLRCKYQRAQMMASGSSR